MFKKTMKLNNKSHKTAKAAQEKLALLSKDLQKVLKKHGLEGAKITGLELRLEDDIRSVNPKGSVITQTTAMSGCVVLPDGSIWCG